ncbi:MAG: efflux RND transporter periplasmic adaptor subunit [Gammaproteobacteria bacterium]|nr:MAG: efflux RND transporter periplasmic adaptor subunit [Gammaproteobacteria bacterium]
MKKILSYGLLVLVLFLFIGTAVFLYKKSQAKPEVYTSDTVGTLTITRKTVATGKVIPRREIDVKSQVSGVIETLYVEAGQTVKQGDLIAKIALRPNMMQVSQAESQLESANINLLNAKLEFDRQKKLYAQKLISESDFNKSQMTYNLQKESVVSTQDYLSLMRSGASKDARKISNMVTATISGMVLNIPNREGAFIVESSSFGAATSVATLADMNDMIFEGLVDESEVGKLRNGMELVLNIGALEGKPFTASLEYISPKGVTDQGTIKFTIRAAVKLNKDLFLRSNYSANADIVLDKKENVVAINEGNLLIEDKVNFVEVETAPQKFEKRQVKTGLSDGINIEIVSGLKAGEKIKHR